VEPPRHDALSHCSIGFFWRTVVETHLNEDTDSLLPSIGESIGLRLRWLLRRAGGFLRSLTPRDRMKRTLINEMRVSMSKENQARPRMLMVISTLGQRITLLGETLQSLKDQDSCSFDTVMIFPFGKAVSTGQRNEF
jgi:hypothetical protein